jgi:hypothetical protein
MTLKCILERTHYGIWLNARLHVAPDPAEETSSGCRLDALASGTVGPREVMTFENQFPILVRKTFDGLSAIPADFSRTQESELLTGHGAFFRTGIVMPDIMIHDGSVNQQSNLFRTIRTEDIIHSCLRCRYAGYLQKKKPLQPNGPD